MYADVISVLPLNKCYRALHNRLYLKTGNICLPKLMPSLIQSQKSMKRVWLQGKLLSRWPVSRFYQKHFWLLETELHFSSSSNIITASLPIPNTQPIIQKMSQRPKVVKFSSTFLKSTARYSSLHTSAQFFYLFISNFSLHSWDSRQLRTYPSLLHFLTTTPWCKPGWGFMMGPRQPSKVVP